MKLKLAIYDFCGTLVTEQTGDEFFLQVLEAGERLNLATRSLLSLGRILGRRRKYVFLLIARNLPRSIFDAARATFNSGFIARNKNKIVIDTIREHQSAGYLTVILSAGYSEYINDFAELYDIDVVLANDLVFENELFTGRLQDSDCYGVKKVTRLWDHFDREEVDLDGSIFYTDSYTDEPVMNLVGTVKLVMGHNMQRV